MAASSEEEEEESEEESEDEAPARKRWVSMATVGHTAQSVYSYY